MASAIAEIDARISALKQYASPLPHKRQEALEITFARCRSQWSGS